MEIMKIFSDVEGTEMLYSVLMDEDELALFSEVKEALEEEEAPKKKLSKKAKVGLGVTGAAAATGAGIYGANKIGRKLEAEGAKVLHNAHVNPGKLGERVANAQVKAGKILQSPAKAIKKLAGSKTALKGQGYAEEAGMKAQELGYKASGALKSHKKLAAGVAAGTAAVGAGLGAAAYLRKRKKDNE